MLIEALGGTVIDYAGVYKCCGFPIITMNKDASLKMAGRHVGDAIDAEADCLVVPCPLCHLNLDLQQPEAAKAVNRDLGLPVLHLPQLVGLALGLEPKSSDGSPHRAPDVRDRLVTSVVGPLPLIDGPHPARAAVAAISSITWSHSEGEVVRRPLDSTGRAPGIAAASPTARRHH